MAVSCDLRAEGLKQRGVHGGRGVLDHAAVGVEIDAASSCAPADSHHAQRRSRPGAAASRYSSEPHGAQSEATASIERDETAARPPFFFASFFQMETADLIQVYVRMRAPAGSDGRFLSVDDAAVLELRAPGKTL